jgi:hypothetical protein
MDGQEAILAALGRELDPMRIDNFHDHRRTMFIPFRIQYHPKIALREAPMNGSAIQIFVKAARSLIKQYPHKPEIGDPGSFIGEPHRGCLNR